MKSLRSNFKIGEIITTNLIKNTKHSLANPLLRLKMRLKAAKRLILYKN